MRKHSLTLLILCLLSAVSLEAQFSKSLHDVIELEDAKELQFDVAGNVTVENWKGGMVLIETKVDLFNATRELLNFLLESDRYVIISDLVGFELFVSSLTKSRNIIQTDNGTVDEQVSVTIRIPEDYVISEDGRSATYVGSGPVLSKIDALHPRRDSSVVAKKMEED